METNITYKVHSKENIYFGIKIIAALLGYAFIIFSIKNSLSSNQPYALVGIIYLIVIVLILFIQMGVMVGYIRGNAVKVGYDQFPKIFEAVTRQSQALGLKQAPDVYIMQAGGVLNAFATKFMGVNYIVLYSDIADEALENHPETLDFVIGHELGHIKRNHILKRLLTLPSILVPFLNSAYSRACEYTCDNIGSALSPKGAPSGLLVLAAGNKLFKQVNAKVYANQYDQIGGFWTWFSEKVSTHPHLSKRIKALHNQGFEEQAPVPVFSKPVEKPVQQVKPFEEDDHNKYMPR